MRRLIRAIEHAGEESELTVSFIAQTLVNSSLAAIPKGYWAGRQPDRLMERAMQRIRSGFTTVESNRDLARELGMNVNAFTRRFRVATGHSPHQYRLRLRIERACSLLREGGLSIEAIAAETGFCDRFHFSRVFKRIMGMGPAQFRLRGVG